MAGQNRTGAMIALIPSEADQERLTVPNGEASDQLHLTLLYWADAAQLRDETQLMFHEAALRVAANLSPLQGRGFGAALFNPDTEDRCLVLEVSGEDIAQVRQALTEMVGAGDGHEPFNAHVTLRYGRGGTEAAEQRVGDILFTHIRVAIADNYVDYPFSGTPPEVLEEVNMEPTEAPVLADADCGCDEEALVAAVNTRTWQSLPIADRETPWDADEAVVRISTWAGMDAAKFGSPYLWKASKGQPLSQDSYRLPIADVVNGKLVMIPRAVFQAANFLSGGHGALEGVLTENERTALKATITNIYDKLQKTYQDPRVVPPWLRGRTGEEREKEAAAMRASVNEVWNLPVAGEDHSWSRVGAVERIREWAQDDIRRYRQAFVWRDPANLENLNAYRLPIADVVDGQLKLVPTAIQATIGMLRTIPSGVNVFDEDIPALLATLNDLWQMIQFDGEDLTASAAPIAPPDEWFHNPNLTGPTPLTVLADGRVYGHLAAWNVCHAGIQDRCVMAPRSQTNYRYFRNGEVVTASGARISVGKITLGTGHATPNLGWIPAADHYDHTGTAVAVVASGEDKYGIWVAGAVVPGVSEERVAELRRSPLSGDWRRVGGNLELVAALAVNTPGFPIARMGANGVQASLVAAGIVLPEGTPPVEEEQSQAAEEVQARLAAVDAQLAEFTKKIKSRRVQALLDSL